MANKWMSALCVAQMTLPAWAQEVGDPAPSVKASTTAVATPESGASVEKPLKIDRNFKGRNPPDLPSDLLQKRIFVGFKDSPKMSKAIGDLLKSRGFKVVELESDSDVKLNLSAGTFIVELTGKGILRACSKSFEQQRQECQMNELQAGVEQALAVLP